MFLVFSSCDRYSDSGDYKEYTLHRICSDSTKLQEYKDSLSKKIDEYLEKVNEHNNLQKSYTTMFDIIIDEQLKPKHPLYMDTAVLNRELEFARELTRAKFTKEKLKIIDNRVNIEKPLELFELIIHEVNVDIDLNITLDL